MSYKGSTLGGGEGGVNQSEVTSSLRVSEVQQRVNYYEQSLAYKPGGYTGCLVGSYQCLVQTAQSLLHSFSALLQLFEHFDILLLLLAGFLALQNKYKYIKPFCLRKIQTSMRQKMQERIRIRVRILMSGKSQGD